MTLRNAFENLAVESKQDAAIALLDNPGGPDALHMQDDYSSGQCLEDQVGVDDVLTFTFSSPMKLVVVLSKGANLTSRADPFGGTPTAMQGFVCDADIPVYLPIATSVVKVYAPAGTTVSVAGFGRI